MCSFLTYDDFGVNLPSVSSVRNLPWRNTELLHNGVFASFAFTLPREGSGCDLLTILVFPYWWKYECLRHAAELILVNWQEGHTHTHGNPSCATYISEQIKTGAETVIWSLTRGIKTFRQFPSPLLQMVLRQHAGLPFGYANFRDYGREREEAWHYNKTHSPNLPFRHRQHRTLFTCDDYSWKVAASFSFWQLQF